MVQWLKSPEGIAAIGAAAYALVCWVASKYPQSPFWTSVRSALTDYKHLNLKALPASLEVRSVGGGNVALIVDGQIVRTVPLIDTVAEAAIRAYVDSGPADLRGSVKLTNDGKPAGDA